MLELYEPIFAHFGHWYIETPVYLAPVVVIAVWLKVAEWRQTRRKAGTSPRALRPPRPGAPQR